MSAYGARLHLPNTTGMPGAFELTLALKQESRPARVVWRDDTQAGVEFVDKTGLRKHQFTSPAAKPDAK